MSATGSNSEPFRQLTKWLSCVLICRVQLTVCPYHVNYALLSEFTLCNSLNVKELSVWSIREIWSSNDCNIYFVNYNSSVASTYLHFDFDCMFLSCHVRFTRANCHSIVVWMSSDLSWTQTPNNLVQKPTLNHWLHYL